MSASAMPRARARLPGTTWVIERRTERRVHLFRPDPLMNQVFLYCLGYALQKTGVRLVACVLMSNHYHAVVHDPGGAICELTELLNGLLTKTTQALRGWQGAVFDRAGPSYVEVLTTGALLDQIGYVLANPCRAGLVRYSKDWPGVRTRVKEIGGQALEVERPPVYFAREGAMPERVEIPCMMPDDLLDERLEEGGLEAARARIADVVEQKEREARAHVESEGRGFKGADRVRKSSPYARAKTYEERHGLNPRYASAGDEEALRAAMARDAEFVERYLAARERWLAGDRDVLWPAGTYAMRRRHRVRCADPPS